jgi:hypothetical protein
MKDKVLNDVTEKVFVNVFGISNPFKIKEILEKFAFDVKIPQEVKDSTTGETTWAESINPTKFISQLNSWKKESWMQETKEVNSIDDIIECWQKINYTTTERNYNSENVFESDTIYNSENVIRSSNCNECKNIMFTDGCHHCEYIIACQRSGESSFCIRVDDSANCTNSYNVACSGKISNSFFIQDCNSLHECMFCAHISNKRFCIANMQFEEEEYYEIKKEVVNWIMNQE